MHDPLLMHMFECTRDLFHKTPDIRLLKLQVIAFLLLDKFLEIAPFRPLSDDNELIIVNERVNILNDEGMVQLFHDVHLPQALFPLPLVRHIENLGVEITTLIFLRAKGTPCSFSAL